MYRYDLANEIEIEHQHIYADLNYILKKNNRSVLKR